MSQPLLEIKDLCVEYRTDEAVVHAINGISLVVHEGETLGLVGETGAGKTTTALSILKLLPDRVSFIKGGTITLDGIDIMTASEADMRLLRGNVVSMIFQDPMTSLNPVVSVGEQIKEILYLHNVDGMPDKELNEHVDEILKMVGISPERKHDFPHQFSGGMKQRIVIAIALACKPKLLLADEPTTALDVTIQAQVLELMEQLKRELNTAMILITHDLGVVAETCDRVAVVYAGEIVEAGTLEHIFRKDIPHHPYTEGLFNSIPNLTRADRLQPIPGLMPDPANLPSGCKFHTRCSRCMECCKSEPPIAVDMDGHYLRCHLFAGNHKKNEVIE